MTLPASAATLRGVDERPYRAAIAAGVKLVMVSWAVYPALDPGRPAGLSPRVVRGELRQRLGFRGQQAVAGLARAYRSGTVSRDSGEAAVARIASLRWALGQ